MHLDADTLRRLSPLLDEALDLDEAQREAWLNGLSGDVAELGPLLRTLLASDAARETGDFLRPLDLAALDPAATADDFHPGDAVGPYRLIETIGQGGMGEVWLAERTDGSVKRRVALKLPVLGIRRGVLLKRFERERDILGVLTHPNIARLYDAGLADDGQPFLALEFVRGQTITDYADRQQLDAAARIRLLRQVMAAVQYAHANLVIHRDLKPSNVLVTDEGQAMLLDFGIAKLLEDEGGAALETQLTQLGGRALSLRYAAPEQFIGGPISTAVDVWALGVLLYELLTGTRPFGASASSSLEQEVLHVDTTAPSKRNSGCIRAVRRGLARDLDTIVLKALKKSPIERYVSVSAFADDLDRWLNGEPVTAQQDSSWYRLTKFTARHRWAVAAGSVAVAVLAGFTFSLDAQVRRVTRERDRADRIAQFMTDAFKVADPSQENSGKVSARELLDAAVTHVDADLAADPELRARLVRTMGRAYTSLGALTQSELLLGKEYERTKRDLGPDHPATLALGAELLYALNEAWKPELAQEVARDIIPRQRRVFGADACETTVTESDLATVLIAEGQFEEAIELEHHWLTKSSCQSAADDLTRLYHQSNVAYAELRLGRGNQQEAERVLRDLVAGNRARFGPTHLKTLLAIARLAPILAMGKHFDEAIELLQRALEESKPTLGATHPNILDLSGYLAAGYIETGQLRRALPILRELIDVNERIEGADSPRAAISRFNLACVEARLGHGEQAVALLGHAFHHGLIRDIALSMSTDGDLASLHGDPRFTKLVAEANVRFGKPQAPTLPISQTGH